MPHNEFTEETMLNLYIGGLTFSERNRGKLEWLMNSGFIFLVHKKDNVLVK